jgi:glucan phosphoethanolaminetransferase (alkaline phosphatase superfamily)
LTQALNIPKKITFPIKRKNLKFHNNKIGIKAKIPICIINEIDSNSSASLAFCSLMLSIILVSINPNKKEKFKVIGDDAVISDIKKQKTVGIFIVGETARADRFSLNGYKKQSQKVD